MKRLTKCVMAIGVLLLAIQLVRFPRTSAPVESDLVAPADIKALLRRACYDCHSNETRWPWYSGVAPMSWIVHRDVNEGRRRLNFSSWGAYLDDPGTRDQKLAEIARFVVNGDMAPWYFRYLHPDARLTEVERNTIVRWTRQLTADASSR